MNMTTELAQRMKAAALKATQGEWCAFSDHASGTYAVHTLEDKRCGDVIKWPGFDGQENAERNAEFIALANPANVLELVDALEAKEQQRANWFQMAQKLGEDLDAAEKRIAELEARTVKLPAAWWVKQGGQSLLAYEKQMLLDALAAAGISVAVEGE